MDPSAGSTPPAPAAPKVRRRLRNYLLDTSLQLKLASYLVAVAAILSAALGWLLWDAYRETSRVVALADPEMGESIAKLLAQEDRFRMALLASALALVLASLLAFAVVVTHRIAGPAYAIGRTCRQVAEGKLAPPGGLRPRDLLVDLAEEVAAMVAALRDREVREREIVAAAAARMRDPAASAADRAAAAEALEALVAEKARRLEP